MVKVVAGLVPYGTLSLPAPPLLGASTDSMVGTDQSNHTGTVTDLVLNSFIQNYVSLNLKFILEIYFRCFRSIC